VALKGGLQGEGGWNAAKIAQVHGDDAANALAASVDKNLRFRETYNDQLRNSMTAQRLAALESLNVKPGTPASNLLRLNLTGLVAASGKKALIHSLRAGHFIGTAIARSIRGSRRTFPQW
jgi:hypothetical protein